MTDMVKEFLDDARRQMAEPDRLLPLLKSNPADEQVWQALRTFFEYVRSVAAFAGFMRAYRLADAALTETRAFLSQKDDVSSLPAILMKFQRIKKILIAGAHLQREPRESDDDLLSDTVEEVDYAVVPSSAPSLVRDVSAQEAALDEREEQLVLWAQSLGEQEAALKRKENVLYEEEHRQAQAEKKISAVMARLEEQEKIQADLEDHLAETRLTLQGYQEKLADREGQQNEALELLESKNKALNEMGAKIRQLTELLDEKENLSEQREEQLTQELQQNRRQAEELRLNLKTLEDFQSELNDERQKIADQYQTLEQEYQDALSRLDEEKNNTEQMLAEKRDLERQHVEFNSRFIALQEALNAEKENLKRTQKALEQQKLRNEYVAADLKAASWPYNAEKIQKELASLARSAHDKKTVASLTVLKDFAAGIRTRSFAQVASVLKKTATKAGKKYQRAYFLAADCKPECGVDKEVLGVIETALDVLTDNAFRYASLPEGNLKINFDVQEDGVFLRCRFFDNGASFDYDTLFSDVQRAGFADKATAVSRQDLLNFLFHGDVRSQNDTPRGLVRVARLLERVGGRIQAEFEDGLRITFLIPKKFLFDRVLMFGYAGRRFALPLNAVAETVFLQENEFGIKNGEDARFPVFYWKGLSLPVLGLSGGTERDTPFGLVVQAGGFTVLVPVQQIFDAEHLLAFSEKSTGMAHTVSCTVLESGEEVPWLDLADWFDCVHLPMAKKIVAVKNDNEDEAESRTVSYLVFKSEPSVFKAVRVGDVLRVEDFSFPPASLAHMKYYETQGQRLILKDSCPRDGYPYAQAVLIFADFALAIQEVADIIDLPDAAAESIVYRGRKVAVFHSEDVKSDM